MLDSLSAPGPALPAGSPVAAAAARLSAAAPKDANLAVCPATCVNLGSFAAAFEARSACVCGGSAQFELLRGAAADTWRHLVHALAALALMGLAALWLLMNLSAQFAHARRDLRDLRM